MSLALNTKHLSSFIKEEEYQAIYPQVEAAHKMLEAKNGPGNDFLGWMYLPLSLIHISEPTRRTPISYAVFCLKKKKNRAHETDSYIR